MSFGKRDISWIVHSYCIWVADNHLIK